MSQIGPRLMMAGVSGVFSAAGAYVLSEMGQLDMPIEGGKPKIAYKQFFLAGATGSLVAQILVPLIL